jgi:PAS domain S-box-containing protein
LLCTDLIDDVSLASASILLVDDRPANLLVLRAVLEDLGVDFGEAHSGEEALLRLEVEDFAAILLDVQMPGLDGFETAKRIRSGERSRHTPIIFLTAYDDDRFSAEQAYSLGAVDYLTKPLVPAILRAKVQGFVDLYREKHRAQREADQLRMLVDGTSEYAIFMLDTSGRVVTWNSGAERLMGYSANEIVGQHFSRFYPEDVDRRWPERDLELARAEGRFEDEAIRVRKDGSQYWSSVVITALYDESGRLTGFSKITRDMSEKKQAQENERRLLEEEAKRRIAEAHAAAIRMEREQLEEADRRKDQFLATLAHELRNPLAPIRNALHILQMTEVEPATTQQSLEMMDRQVNHLVRLVDDLLDVSRVTRGKIELRIERVELSEVIARAAESVQPVFDQHRHHLSVELPSEPLWLDTDAIRLTQVIGNLLTNAAKYTEPEGRISVSASRAGDFAVLHVRDNGIGISPEVLPHVFDLFMQADHAVSKSQGGLGIGLTLVKSLIEMLGGTVEAHSQGRGFGSEFVIKSPLASVGEKPSDPNEAVGNERSASTERYRLLVVDDNLDAANSLGMILRLKGHQVRIAHSGPAALELVESHQPEMIFLDIGMPGMDGYEVARHIRQESKFGTPVLAALTGWGQQDDRRRSAEVGFDHHLVKPIDIAAIDTILEGLAGRDRAEC